MATITDYALASVLTPVNEGGITTNVFRDLALTATAADATDDITVLTLPVGVRVVDASLSVDGTLGAGCTIQLRQGTTALTAATTAGGADFEQMNVFPPAATTAATTINILVGGADIAAAAGVKVHVAYVRV